MIDHVAGDPYELVSPEDNDRMICDEQVRDRLEERLGPMCDTLNDDEVSDYTRLFAFGLRCGRMFKEGVR